MSVTLGRRSQLVGQRIGGGFRGDAAHRGRAGDGAGDGRAGAARFGDIVARLRDDGEAGMATAEYAIATVAAAGFAGLLIVILRSNEVRELLLVIIRGALSI